MMAISPWMPLECTLGTTPVLDRLSYKLMRQIGSQFLRAGPLPFRVPPQYQRSQLPTPLRLMTQSTYAAAVPVMCATVLRDRVYILVSHRVEERCLIRLFLMRSTTVFSSRIWQLQTRRMSREISPRFVEFISDGTAVTELRQTTGFSLQILRERTPTIS